LAQRAGALGVASEAALAAGCVSSSQLRHFAAQGEPPKIVPNPLQQIVPPILKGVGAAVDGLKSGSSALWEGLTSGPATQATIAYLADTVLLSGNFVDRSALDMPKWAAWLASNGYTNKEGWDKLMEGIKASVDKLEPSDVEALVPALHAVGRYDKQLFQQMADIVKARFTEFETPGLAKIIPTYAAHDIFDQALWDDAADSITYCNHYFAPNTVPLEDLAALFAAYAKYEVDRGDLFVTLARCIHEDRLKALDDPQLKEVVGSLLQSFKALHFYPDCTEALLVAARLRPQAMGPTENTLAAEVEKELRGHAPEGKLAWLDGGFKDPDHFHGQAFGSYNLWVTRDELISQYYKPSDVSPRPASMTTELPISEDSQAAAAPSSSSS
jgi:protein phosphatase 1 regulatory subunit 42